MNRAEKRRQQKLAEKAAKKGGGVPVSQEHAQALNLAVGHHQAGRLQEAEAIYRQILQADPKQPNALNLLGMLAHQVGQTDVAVELLTQAVSTMPGFAEAHNNLGNALKDLGELSRAAESYRKAISITPAFSEAQYNLGVVCKDAGELEGAVACYDKAIAINPNYVKAHYNRGVALYDLGQLNDAAFSYQNALKINPDYAEAHSNLGNVFRDLGQLDESVHHCRKAVEIMPEFAEAHVNLGLALQRQGNNEDAITCYKGVISIHPDFTVAYSNLGTAYIEIGQFDKAVAQFNKAIELNPEYTEAYVNLGLALNGAGKMNEAIKNYQIALGIDPRFSEAFNNIWFALRPKCREILAGVEKTKNIEQIIDSLSTPPEPEIIRFRYKSLLGEDTQKAWEGISRNLPNIENETVVNSGKNSRPGNTEKNESPDRKITALLQFGRSGTGYLHSLLDDHPEISTLPGVYLSGFFGRGVWENIIRGGYQNIPELFSRLYKVLFDARCPDEVPPPFIGDSYATNSIGLAEGFVKMGVNQDTPLTLNREQFLKNLTSILNGQKSINCGQFFEAVHDAFETTRGRNHGEGKNIFYHLHSIDPYSLSNFLKSFSNAQLLMIIRKPVQSCESWALKAVDVDEQNGYTIYSKIVNRIISMLTDLNCPAFHLHDFAAVRLEDIKSKPEETMRRLCLYLGIKDTPSLYQSTMQGLKWWGDPSSNLYGRTHDTDSWDDDPTRMKAGTLFNTSDQFILETLFYPLSAQFGYVEEDQSKFDNDLAKIRPLLEKPLNFEIELARKFPQGYPNLETTEAFKSFHAVLIGTWRILDEHQTYPYMLKALPE